MPTNGFSIKPLKVKLLQGSRKQPRFAETKISFLLVCVLSVGFKGNQSPLDVFVFFLPLLVSKGIYHLWTKKGNLQAA